MQDTQQLLWPLLKMLDEIKPISADLQNALFKYFKPKQIANGSIILHEGEICKNLWFLAEGLLRSYHKIGNNEVTSRIMFTNHIVIAPGSFFTQTPATESIEALKDCTLVALPFTSLQILYNNFPEFNYHTRLITEQYFYKQEQRLYMLRKHDAMAKYEYFLENYSSYAKDIPQKYIASFLNIAPETLSRTRSKLRNK